MTEREPPYLITYFHKGAEWSLQLPWAENWEDAEQRIRAIGYTGKVAGSNVSTYSPNLINLPFIAVWVRILTWWKNLIREKN
jgi:hypothetical protein